MSNRYSCPALNQIFKSPLNLFFRFNIYGRGCLIKNEYSRINKKRPGNAYSLTLASGEKLTALPRQGIVAIRKSENKLVSAGSSCRPDNFVSRGIGLPIGDILSNGPVK